MTNPVPRLIAIGGFSGTGKTTLAAAIAPLADAIHLRSDVERKRLAGIAETARLPASDYTEEATRGVYEHVLRRARSALEAGQGVVLDAVFARDFERLAVAALARDVGASYVGLWLQGSRQIMQDRVATRTGDASDATPDVVERQFGYQTGAITWTTIGASGSAADVLSAARAALRL